MNLHTDEIIRRLILTAAVVRRFGKKHLHVYIMESSIEVHFLHSVPPASRARPIDRIKRLY